VGALGELHVGGLGVARGYLNNDDRTSARFVTDPFNRDGRMYATGDLVRLRASGDFEYHGRVDSQIKLRGYRIELREIEEAIRTATPLRQVAVVLRADDEGDPQLVAYLVPERTAAPPELIALRAVLGERLPHYMVPSAFVVMPALPLTASAKLDRAALPAPELQQVRDARTGPDIVPQNALERQLQEIWQRVLGVRPIGVDDDFFALGGHSLKAIRLLDDVEKTLGGTLRAAALFEAPTIRTFAALLRDRAPRAPSTIIPVQGRGTQRPLFFAPGGGGELFVFDALGRALGSDQPLYVLDMYVFDEIQLPANPFSLADVAARMIADMRTIQPVGPYRLAGYSLGGNIVLEMAQQLMRAGVAVDLLMLLDCDGPRYPYLQPFGTRVLEHLRHARSMGAFGAIRYLLGRVRRMSRYVVGAPPPELNLYANEADVATVPKHVIDALEATLQPVLQAWERYEPRFYQGDAVLIYATRRRTMIGVVDDDPRLGWGPFIGGSFRVELLDCAHNQMLDAENTADLARILRRYL
jgi:thioesterase domain-containing protein/acyl carrier protein